MALRSLKISRLIHSTYQFFFRSAGLNQCVESSNKLLQAMLQNKLATAVNAKNLLELYVAKTIHLNDASLQTLIVLVATQHLPSM